MVRDENNEGHAILTVRTDEGDFVLDNKRREVVRWNDRHSYIFIKEQSQRNPVLWVLLVPPDSAQQPVTASNSRSGTFLIISPVTLHPLSGFTQFGLQVWLVLFLFGFGGKTLNIAHSPRRRIASILAASAEHTTLPATRSFLAMSSVFAAEDPCN